VNLLKEGIKIRRWILVILFAWGAETGLSEDHSFIIQKKSEAIAMYSQKDVIEANVLMHTRAAEKYKEIEPHYSPENIERVRCILKSLKGRTEGNSLLDVGCGTGFVIDIAKEYFKVIRGVDVTPAMIEKADTASPSCDIKVEIAESENLPFKDHTFDVCTAYALLHHLHDIQPTFNEIFRVLKSGGIFYSDLDPNAYFWEAISLLPSNAVYCHVLKREIDAVLNKEEELAKLYGIDKKTIQKAEYLKHVKGGFKEEELSKGLKAAGFSNFKIKYEWFLGEGNIIHDERTNASAGTMRSYFHEMLPLTRHLFKYVSIYAEK
jgi:ubiquinone/menaquinone biosynthesis C-methylase UbiE